MLAHPAPGRAPRIQPRTAVELTVLYSCTPGLLSMGTLDWARLPRQRPPVLDYDQVVGDRNQSNTLSSEGQGNFGYDLYASMPSDSASLS